MAKCEMCNKVISHLKGDIKGYAHEAKEDKELIKELARKKKSKAKAALKLKKKPARKPKK